MTSYTPDIALSLALHLAPARELLGTRTRYIARSMSVSDCRHFEKDIERAFYSKRVKAQMCRIVIVKADQPRKPLFALIASGSRSKSNTLCVHVAGNSQKAEMSPRRMAGMYLLCLRVAEVYAALAAMSEVVVRSVHPEHKTFLENAGSTVMPYGKRCLYAVTKPLMKSCA